jgi:hypothetical protein
MTRTRRHAATLAIALPAMLLAACGKPDQAALSKGNDAFKGQTVDGELQPVTSRVVMVGGDAPNGGCTTASTDSALAVHWSASTGPVKAELTGDYLVCEQAEGWTGIVFPAFGQAVDECALTRRIPRREYQGPCRWGWIENSAGAEGAS